MTGEPGGPGDLPIIARLNGVPRGAPPDDDGRTLWERFKAFVAGWFVKSDGLTRDFLEAELLKRRAEGQRLVQEAAELAASRDVKQQGGSTRITRSPAGSRGSGLREPRNVERPGQAVHVR